ncbi:hypothetical protein RB653_010270 [Dictyostelium firmibasis]|uniref:Transcription factor CBF/NF-Y/archaeal histone domain-containing protein n=1 Tax=Dictyostelium firmibasis TaxID=79012 RepID=A0AAN7YVF7_9MYCE
MSESQDLPGAIVNRIIKASLPEGVLCAKESRLAIAKAAKVWIHYLTAASIDFSQHSGRSTVSPKDVLQAIEEIDFEIFKPQLEEYLAVLKSEKEKEKERDKEKEKEKEKEREREKEKDKDNNKDDTKSKDENKSSKKSSSSKDEK